MCDNCYATLTHKKLKFKYAKKMYKARKQLSYVQMKVDDLQVDNSDNMVNIEKLKRILEH